MLLTKVTSAMKTRAQLDEQAFEQLLAAAYLLQQQRESIPFPAPQRQPAMNEAERLAAIAEAQALVHGSQLRLQERLHLVAEHAQRITGGSGAAIWLLRGSQTLCQLGCGILSASAGQSIALEGSRLTACLRDGAVVRCPDAKSDPRTRFDALPGVAEGSVLAVPIHFEGRVQGALEVTFAEPWGFEDADVRTCQILSGLVSEAVAVAAGQEQMNILHSERATLLDALDRLQPHLSKLFNSAGVSDPAQNRTEGRNEGRAQDADETSLPLGGLTPSPVPTHGLARLGKYLLDRQEHGRVAHDPEQDAVSKPAPREVHTALNFSVTAQQPDTRSSRANSPRPAEAQDFKPPAFDAHEFEPDAGPDAHPYLQHLQPYENHDLQPYESHALEAVRPAPSMLTPAEEPWLRAGRETPAAEPPAAIRGFWQLHGADVCLAASAVVLAASLIWALWPHSKKTMAANAPAAAAPAEPKLSAFEELLVSMGLAEAPPPPAAYAGTPGTRVWVDINSALYYCPGADPYGKTPKGKYLTQREAQDEQFQPARGQPCD
jgi:GAF domain-containing protein